MFATLKSRKPKGLHVASPRKTTSNNSRISSTTQSENEANQRLSDINARITAGEV
jgi:hypothetical protein